MEKTGNCFTKIIQFQYARVKFNKHVLLGLCIFVLTYILHNIYKQTLCYKVIDSKQLLEEHKLILEMNGKKVILLWDLHIDDSWSTIGIGAQPFKKCFHKECFSSRDRSLLYNPNIAVDAIIFHGVGLGSGEEFQKIRQFKESQILLKTKNKGIQPKFVLYMMVSNVLEE